MPLKPTCAAADPIDFAVDLLAIGVAAGDAVASQEPLASLDQRLNGALGRLIEREEFTGKKDQSLELNTLGQLAAGRLLLVGLGDPSKVELSALRTFAARAARAGNSAKATSIALVLPGKPDPAAARAIGEGIVLGEYRFTKYFTGERQPKAFIQKATFLLPRRPGATDALKKAFDLGVRIGRCVSHTRDLVNEPPNELYPAQLASFAQSIAKTYKLACKVFGAAELTKMGAKLMLAVGQGSAHEPRLVHLTYKPARATKKRLVIVGKGLTFDSGGLSIKPAQGMGEMKSDMAGAGNVIGLMAAVAELQPPVEVHGIVAAAENMPDGNAYRPGDVFGSLDGKTVEIINTDAEGRLVLADALAYARKLQPTVLICNATLTGACMVALGQRCSGYYATNDELAVAFKNAASAAGEQFWQLPLLEDLHDQLKSDIADLKHTGDRWGGSITAALFLRDFVGDVPFVHCDIAGAPLADKPYSFYPKGGTGHGVLTFLRFIEDMA